jgi:8-oxo-dGTP pyrophosphatase MutT (NUDIX family)
MDVTVELVPRLRSILARRAAQRAHGEEARRAAVAVVVSDEPEAALLLVRRRERAGDPWSGHIAFPGGFCAEDDASADATAAREAEEETGLPLARLGDLLGHLDDVAPKGPLLPRVVVTPVVFAVLDRPPVSASHEIAEAAWLPVRAIFDPASRRSVTFDLPGGRRAYSVIEVAGFSIWGLTERVLAQIPALLADAS